MKIDGNRLSLEKDHILAGDLTAVFDGAQLSLSVAQEQAVDSYNAEFECTVELSRSEAEELHRWLGAMLADQGQS